MNKFVVAGIAAAVAFSLIAASGNLLVQPAFAHSLNMQSVEVHGAGERQVTIVLGHANEPAYGAKPGISDGRHAVEVELEDTATALPLTGASLKVDKYYFTDFGAFDRAQSVDDATEVQKGITVGSVFGDPGHYMARQVINDGIYGYRLYGNISYFGVANMTVDSTVFCTSSEGNTTKFNSAGWSGGFGCPENIDNVLFPTKNSNVNSGNGRVSLEVPAASSSATVQQASTTITGGSASTTAAVAPTDVAATTTESASTSALQLLTFGGIPAAAVAVAALFGVRSYRQNRRIKDI
ncbi:MAG TPA: hypothetical protein VJP79_01440 [Nitrososphaera sp.]|nr:hypothetical protein [Nitrososphaera sp.]